MISRSARDVWGGALLGVLMGAAACDSGSVPPVDAAAPGADGATGSDAAAASDVASGADMGPARTLLPLAVGNSWTYRVVHPKDGTFMKVNRVERWEPIPFGPRAGTSAFLLTTTKLGGANDMNDRTDSWQLPDGDSVVRFAERTYRNGTSSINDEMYWHPFKLRVDGTTARRVAGQIWEERYAESTIRQSGTALTAPATSQELDIWTVESADEMVMVDAGTFPNCVRLKKAGSSTDAGKTYWYCLGIGKVKELGQTGTGQSEYLSSYDLR